MPQSQWDRPVRAEWLFLGGLLVVAARIASNFLEPGWLQVALDLPLSVTIASVVAVKLHGGTFTARRVAVIPILAVVGATTFEVSERWGWVVAAPLVVLTLVFVYKAARAGMFGPARPIEAPPVLPSESSR